MPWENRTVGHPKVLAKSSQTPGTVAATLHRYSVLLSFPLINLNLFSHDSLV